jgi:hypothetical protein
MGAVIFPTNPMRLSPRMPVQSLGSKISRALNRCSENVAVEAIIIPELELRNVEWHVFGAYLVERADDPALEDRPKALNRLGVDSADNVLMLGVVNCGVRIGLIEALVANPLIGAEQANLFRYSLVDERDQGRGADVIDDAGDDVALAADSASNNRFSGSGRTGLAVALVPMPVLRLATDEGFVDLDNAAELGFGFDEGSADFMAHGMRRTVAAEAHDALNLEGANSLLARQHQMSDAEPLAERLIRILKDCARDMREAIASVRSALIALPFEGHRSNRKYFGIATARANHALRPTARDQIRLASIFIREHRLKLSDGHLMDLFRSAGHVASPVYGGQYGM